MRRGPNPVFASSALDFGDPSRAALSPRSRPRRPERIEAIDRGLPRPLLIDKPVQILGRLTDGATCPRWSGRPARTTYLPLTSLVTASSITSSGREKQTRTYGRSGGLR